MKTTHHKYKNLHNAMVDAMRRAEPLRTFLVLSLLLLLVGSMSGQSADCNYIRVVEPLAGSVVEPSTDAELSRVGITYFDGLGREVQQVAVGQGGDGEDIVTLTEYDRYGNAYRDWLATPDPLAEQYPHLTPYAHCANNPLTIVDPSGCLLVDRNGKIVYRTDGSTYNMPFKNYDNSISIVEMEVGYIYANDGTPIIVLNNNVADPQDHRWDTNCHGVTFADGKYFITGEQSLSRIINHDGYQPIDISDAQNGDVVMYSSEDNNYYHSATITDIKTNPISVRAQDGPDVITNENSDIIMETDEYTVKTTIYKRPNNTEIQEDEIQDLPIPGFHVAD